ncbi:winged helix-turn-helix domain-containing protein [Thermofilum pendens]|nr:winged helix-turn-helix domain-containing protein [Thermofilum pendens]
MEKRAFLALLLLLSSLYVAGLYRSEAQPPALVVLSGSATLKSSSSSNGTHLYVLSVRVPPLSKLSEETIACVYNAGIASAKASLGVVEVRGGGDYACLTYTFDNRGLGYVEDTVSLVVVEPPRAASPPVAEVAVAVAAVAATSYLTLTESGRQKLFAALSAPVAYYVAKREDVLRSEKRVRILEYLKQNPGASMRRISRETGVSFGEVQWHLSILERLGYVQRVRIGKYTVYYPTGVPAERWLACFAERELGLKVKPGALEKALPSLEEYLAFRQIPLEALRSALGS